MIDLELLRKEIINQVHIQSVYGTEKLLEMIDALVEAKAIMDKFKEGPKDWMEPRNEWLKRFKQNKESER